MKHTESIMIITSRGKIYEIKKTHSEKKWEIFLTGEQNTRTVFLKSHVERERDTGREKEEALSGQSEPQATRAI